MFPRANTSMHWEASWQTHPSEESSHVATMTINTWHGHRRYGYTYPVLSGRELWQRVPQPEADRKKQLWLLLAALPSQRMQPRRRSKEPGGAIIMTKGGCIPQHQPAHSY